MEKRRLDLDKRLCFVASDVTGISGEYGATSEIFDYGMAGFLFKLHDSNSLYNIRE